MWVAAARISGKTLTDANQFMFCGLRYRILRRVGGARLHALGTKDKIQPPQLRTKLNWTALRFVPHSIVKWRGELSRVKMNAKKRRP